MIANKKSTGQQYFKQKDSSKTNPIFQISCFQLTSSSDIVSHILQSETYFFGDTFYNIENSIETTYKYKCKRKYKKKIGILSISSILDPYIKTL